MDYQDSGKLSRPRISIVLPTFNPGEYLHEAVESIINQTIFDKIELIVVDDGSEKIHHLDIARKKWSGINNVRFVSVSHGGLSHARNEGIKLCRAEYIAFCDDDDMYHPQAMERMLSVADKTGAEIVQSWISFKPDKLSAEGNCIVVDGHTAALWCLRQTHGVLNSAWARLIKKRLFDTGKMFPVGLLYEDLALIPALLAESSKVALLSDPLYYYRQREGSIIHVFNQKRLDVLDITAGWERTFASDPGLLAAARDRSFSAACNILILYLQANKGRKTSELRNDETVRRCLQIIETRRKEVASSSEARLKNRLGAYAARIGYPLFRIASLFKMD